MTCRKATHAGSWYESKGVVLGQSFKDWIDQAGKDPLIKKINQYIVQSPSRAVKALIAPHAGYSYSGPTAAYAYQALYESLKVAPIENIFILGPSHHHYTKKCEISKHEKYNTPMGDISINQTINQALFETGEFDWMDTETDDDEHSIEMHCPFVKHALDQAKSERTKKEMPEVKIVPILVGSLTLAQTKKMSDLLYPYWTSPVNMFIISTDFCHWGQRFRYTYYDPQYATIGECVESLDRLGMSLIESKDSQQFENYDREFRNTICGRHPIAILLSIIDGADKAHKEKTIVRFVKYAQSQSVKSKSESSVSYASGIVWRE